ncbi:hypothetical protein Ddye_025200 [Dipteronia dyeriana]|uniref:Reverse transcriptase domain-containing protein n=1 Tax=Dipteronia dyeriana TaxID=168575 RepID=A0AAD9TWS2_9ROSI|nr:hypothetical protein Ddye_025200 [Dipteronia dyeriana]
METEDRYWKQRAKVEWLRSGDRNTKFFHSNALARKARNRIQGLMDDDGVWKDSRTNIKRIAVQYFNDIFCSSNSSALDLSLNRGKGSGAPWLSSWICPRLTTELNEPFWMGLRQGDPLSSFLFLFYAEGLTSLLNKAHDNSDISGFNCSRGGPVISHLFFTDDSLIFAKANDQNCRAIKTILDQYARASSQVISYGKSIMCTSPSYSVVEGKRFTEMIGVQLVDCHEKYLRLPCFTGRSKRNLFSNITDRVWGKIKGWGEKLLSTGGKEILIKTVVQCWRILKNSDSLAAKVLKGCYYREGSFLDAESMMSGSFVWNNLMWSKGLMDKGIRWRVGNNKSIKIYNDRWIPRPPTFKVFSHPKLDPGPLWNNLLSRLGDGM